MICPPILKSPNPSKASLVRHSLYKLNSICDKQHSYLTSLPILSERLSNFPSSRYLSSSGSNPLDLSCVGGVAGSNATADLVLRVTETHKPLYHDKVEIPTGGQSTYNPKTYIVHYSVFVCFVLFSQQRENISYASLADSSLETVWRMFTARCCLRSIEVSVLSPLNMPFHGSFG
jgi:hypothetical protein